jgi:hypothetical protein
VHGHVDNVDLVLMTAMGITAVIWVVLEARHNGRFGRDRGPMSPLTRNLLMWLGFIEILGAIFRQMQHGIFF